MADRRVSITNLAETAVSGHRFVSFDVAMSGHVIATVDAPMLSGRIIWQHAAIQGFRDFDPAEKHQLADQVTTALANPPRKGH